ncbi:MAG: tail fiber domain-containing protein, partial [Candidatus Pacebacteria bacterium]|nr:tail fiber domain-containing protein [Candidatus Paceibacterota bacterium]
NVGIGTTAPDGKLEVYGAGQLVSDLTDAGSRDNMLMINSSGTSGGSGGALVFGNSQSKTADSLGWAAIKAHLTNGSGNTVGNLTFSTRNSTSDTALTQRMTILSGGNIGIGVSSPSQQLEITGDFELPNTTHADESGIIYKGTSPFIHNFNYGDNGSVTTVGGNTFVGVDSGNFTMGSTAVSALSASYNTGVGEDSLKSLTLGYGNTASGYNSLASNTTGSLNSALGYYALFDNTTGNYNTGVGTESLANNTIGDSNTAIGNNSLWNNVDGSNNSALGHSALVGNEDGDLNIAIGYDAGHYYGDYAMSNTSGNKNIYLGVQTKSAGYDKENEIVIGYTAEGIGSNSVVLGNESITTTALRGNVGIGTTDPGAKTEIYQAMSDYGSAFTSPHLNLGASNTVDNTGFVGITYDTSATANYGWSSGALRSSSGQGDFVWKFHSASAVGSELMRITSTGNVGIGTTDPVSVLHIKDTTWTNLSIEATSDDPSLQLTSDGSGTSNDWTMRMDVSDSDKLQWRYDGTKKLTITSPGQLIMTNDNWLSADNNAGTDYVNMFKVNTSDEIDVGATLNVGAMEFSEDSGFVTAMDMPVSSTPTAGDIEAYAFKVDGDNILTVYAEADGAGGIQNARVGIGDSSPSYQLELSTDSAAKPGTSSWTVSSDERLKDVNGDFTRGLDALSGLYPSYFNYKTDNDLGIPSDREYVGLIAQDVQSVIPEAVREGKEGFLSIESDAIFWTMLNAIKEIGLKVGSDNITYTRDTLQVLNGTGEPQMKLAYDEENLAEFNVSAVGDLSLSTAGKDIRLPDDNLSVCSGGACSSAASLIEGTGNLVVENVAYIAGSLGVGTAQPSRGLDVYESQSDPQFRISYDDDLYSEFNVSATGDLIISAEGGDISVLNENLRVCSDEGCPSIASQIKDSGNLVVENSLLALGNVGIGGTISPDYTLDVQGTLRAYGITDASDARLKTNIQPLIHLGVAPPSEGISATLENVKKLRGVTFEWKNEDFGTGIQIGMIAQELEEVYPDLVSTDDSGFKSIQYGKFTAVLLEAVKDLINFGEKIEYRSARLENRTAELEEKNIELEKQAESLEQKTQTLEARIEALENILRQ